MAGSGANIGDLPACEGGECLCSAHRHDRHLRLVQVGERAHAGQRITALRRCGGALGAHGGDLTLDQSAFERGGDTARRLDLAEQRPRRLAKLVRQILDRAGAGGRIGDVGEMGFLNENELGVAGDAPRETLRAGRARP